MDELDQELENIVSRGESIQTFRRRGFTKEMAEQFVDATDDETREDILSQWRQRIYDQDMRRRRYRASWFGRNDEWLMPVIALAIIFLIIGVMFLVNN